VIKVFIYLTFGKAQTDEITIDPGVLIMGCLFEFIQYSLEFAHMWLSITNLKLLRLFNIYLLLNNSIEERCPHIHLVDIPSHL